MATPSTLHLLGDYTTLRALTPDRDAAGHFRRGNSLRWRKGNAYRFRSCSCSIPGIPVTSIVLRSMEVSR